MSKKLARRKLVNPPTAPRIRRWTDARRSVRRHVIAGVILVLLLAGGVGGWAATSQIKGAVIAQGSIVVDSNVKKVQHPSGGVVGELKVHDGDRVKAGDVVVRLDDTVTRANLAIVTKGLNELLARKARLSAERDGAATITFPAELTSHAGRPRCGGRDVERGETVRAAARGPRGAEGPIAPASRPARAGNPGAGGATGLEKQRDRPRPPRARRREGALCEKPGPARLA